MNGTTGPIGGETMAFVVFFLDDPGVEFPVGTMPATDDVDDIPLFNS